METSNDRRLDPRVRVKVRLTLTDPASGRRVVLHTTNLSAGGASCTALAAVDWSGEWPGRLEMPVSEGGRDFEVPIELSARLVRRNGCDLGVAFVMNDAARVELRRMLLDCMAADTVNPACLVGCGA